MATIEKEFTTHDNTFLFYRYKPSETEEKKAIVIFHRGHEHSGRVFFMADELQLNDFAFFAYDARGHGKSPGERGDSPSIGTSIQDIQAFISHIHKAYDIPIANIVVIAQSVGAALVSGWLHDYAPKIRCAILASPAFHVKLYVPFARPALRLMQKFRGNFYVNSYVKSKYLTHDTERNASFDQDELISRAISVRMLLGLHQLGKRIVQDAFAIDTPTQLLISGDDWVVSHKPQYVFFNKLGSLIKEKHTFPGFYHDTLGEKNRELAFIEIRRFVHQCFDTTPPKKDLCQNHLHSESRYWADVYNTPVSKWTPTGMYWALYRQSTSWAASFSEGFAIGQASGFDSGQTLDYIYQNTPQGKGKIGRYIDQFYLNQTGWVGIRERKKHLESAIQKTIALIRDQNMPVHILDIAAGYGRYVIEALDKEHLPDSIRLRDFSQKNVDAGRHLIQKKHLENLATFEAKNAFLRDNYQGLDPLPTLGIVSGLFELFSDNDLIMNALNGFSDAIAPKAYLIYTNQPWHPQQEMIARSLTSHRDGQNWVMRCRSQQEMDQLVERAGFTKIDQWIDEEGIFTVSIARKN